MSDEAHEATPDHELERQIMSYNEAKNEREWWAMHEIERLREALRGVIRVPDKAAFDAARAALGEESDD